MFTFPVRVYYSDTDAQGIVYHGRYLDYAEHARTEMLRSIGKNQSSMPGIMVVSSIAIEYKRPGHLDEELVVQTEVERVKVFSLVLKQTVRRGDEVLAILTVKIASVDKNATHPLPLAEDVVAALRSL